MQNVFIYFRSSSGKQSYWGRYITGRCEPTINALINPCGRKVAGLYQFSGPYSLNIRDQRKITEKYLKLKYLISDFLETNKTNNNHMEHRAVDRGLNKLDILMGVL